jgi:predicted nucleic acid-binding protein
MRVFIDTNLWVYRLDRREPAKSERLKRWLAEVSADHEIVISTQVLIELRAVASRKLQPPLPAAEIATMLEALAGFEVVNTDANLVLDALIAEAAIRSRCAVLFSEDFSHGRRLAGLEVVNPLRG